MTKMNELLEKVSKDKDLQAKYVEIIQSCWNTGEDAINKLIDFAKDAGYDINADEMIEYLKGVTASKEGELTDSELDNVAGGVIGDFFPGPGFPFPGGPRPFPGGPVPFPGMPGQIVTSINIAGHHFCSNVF